MQASVRGSIPADGRRVVAPLRRRARDRAAPHRAAAVAAASRREAAGADVIERQHVWLGPEATSFDEPCEACLAAREALEAETVRRARDAARRRRRRLHHLPPRPPHRDAPRAAEGRRLAALGWRRACDRRGRCAVGRRGQGQDRRPARPGIRCRVPLPGRPECRAHDRRRRRDVQDPPDAERRHLRQDVGDRRRLRRRPAGAARRARRARSARDRRVGRRRLRERAPDHAVARRDRPGVGAAARPPADRHDAPRDRPGVRGQGVAHRHPRAGRARPEDPAPEDRGRARREEPLARAHLRGGAVRPRGGVGAVRRARGAARAVRRRRLAARRPRARRRQGRALRGRAGDAARPRPRHVSVRHVVEPDRVGRGDRDRHRPDAHRPRARRLEGVRDARRRRAVPVGDRRARPGAGCASSAASTARSPAASAAAAGSTWSRSATRCA